MLNSLIGDLLYNNFEVCADFGPFREIGDGGTIDHGWLSHDKAT